MKWPTVPLGEVCSLQNGRAFREELWSQTGLPIIRIQNLNGRGATFNYWDGSLDSQILVKPGDLLLAWSGTPGTSFGAHIWEGPKGVLNQHIFRVDLDSSRVYSRWALRAINNQLDNLIGQAHGGVGLKHVTRGMVEGLQLKLPPLEEQRRTAAILDKADALRQKRRTALQKLDSLTQSIFLDMFGDPVTNSGGWPLISIEEIGTVVTGNTPSREHPEFFGDTIDWVKSDNLNTPHYYVTRSTEGLSEIGRTVARTAPSSSILVTCIAGSPSCIGNAAMTDREVAFNQQINALIPKDGDPRFLYAEIILAKKRIQGASTNGMKGMVSKSRFEKILLPFPPIEMQKSFALRSLDLQKMQATSSSSLDMFENLFDALQHRAFRGEL